MKLLWTPLLSLLLLSFAQESFSFLDSKHLKFFNEQIIETSFSFNQIPVGGLSAIRFDRKTNSFLILSDDKKNHRFYRFKLKKQKPYQLNLVEQILLKERGFKKLKRNMDPEGISLGSHHIFIASEGQQIFTPPEPPQIFRFSQKGLLLKAWETPSVFWNLNQIKTHGAQENKGFESLTLDLQKNLLWTATERPLLQDLKVSKKRIRLSGFSLKTKKLLFQFPYSLSDSKAGLVEMLFLKPQVFLTLERTYNKFKKTNRTRLFLTDCRKATNLTSPPPHSSCKKKKLFDFKRLGKIKIDNLEGMTLGPKLPKEQRLLVFVSDNNFNKKQKTQILFFGFKIPSSL